MPLPFAPLGSNRDRGTPAPRMPFSPPSYRDPASSQGAIAAGVRASFVEDAAKEEAKRDQIAIQNESLAQRERAAQQRQIDQAARTQETEAKRVAAEAAKTKRADDNRELARAEFQAAALPPVMTPLQRADLEAEHTKKDKALRARAAARLQETLLTDPEANATTGGFLGMGGEPTPRAAEIAQRLTTLADPANLNDSDLEEFRKIEPTAFDERDTLKKRLEADSVAQTQRDTVTRSVARAKALKAGVPEAELDTLVPPTGALPGADPWQRIAQAGALERDNAQVAQLAQGIEAGKTELADIDAQIEGITAEASKGGSATQVMQSQEAIMQLRQQRDQKAQALQATIERHNSQLTAIEAKSRALNEQAEAAKAPVADEAPKPAVPLAYAKAAAKLEADGSYSTSQIDNLQSLASAGVKAYWADPQTTTKATPESREAKTKAVNDSIDTVQKLGADLTASAQEIQRRIENEVRSGRLAPESAQREQEKAFAEYEKSHEEQIVARGEYLHSALRDFSEGQIDADTLNAVYHAAGGSQTGVEAFAELQAQLKKDAEHVDALTAVILGEDGKGSADPGLNGQLLGLAATAAEGSAKYAQWLNAGDYPEGMSQGEITASESNAQAGAEEAKKAKAEMERLRTEQHNKLAAELVKRGADAGQIPGLIAQAELQSLAKARPGIASVVASRGGITAFTAEKLPFVGGLVEAARILPYAETALKLENGEAVTPEEMQALGEFVRFTQEKPSLMASVTDGVASLPGFAIELYSTAGIAGAVRKGGNKAIKEVLERVATKQGRARLAAQMAKSSADNVVAAWSKNNAKKAFGVKLLRGLAEEAVRLPVASAGRIVSKYTQDLATEGVNVTNEDGHMAAVIDSDQRSKPLLRVANAVIDSYIENVSERSGFLLGKIPGGKFLASKLSALSKAAKSKLVSVAMFKAFVRANPGAAPGKIAKILKSANIGSVPEEMFEERLGSAARDVWNGLSGKGWESTVIPSPEDFGVEFLTFLVPGAHAAIQTQRHFGKLDRAITASDSEATSHMDGFASDPAAHAQRLSQLVGAPISADDITRATDLTGPVHQSDAVRTNDRMQVDLMTRSEEALNQGQIEKASKLRQMALDQSRQKSRSADGELLQGISAAGEIDGLHAAAEEIRTQASRLPDQQQQAAAMLRADDMELMGDRISALVKVATGREAVLTQNEKEALNHPSMKPAVVEENGALIITDEARDQMEQFAPTAAKYVKQSETMRREQLGQAAAVAAQPATQEAPTPTAAPAEQGTAPAPSTAPAPAATAAEPQWTATGDKGTVVSIPASEAKTRAQAEAKLVSKLPKGENLRGGTLQKPKAPKPTPEATTAAPEPAPIDYGTGETFDSGKFAEAAKARAAKLKNPKAKAHYERVVDAIAKAVKSRGKAFPNGVKLDYTMKDGGGAMLKGGALVVNPDLIGTQTTELSDDELNAWVSAVSSEEFIHLAQVQSLSTKQAEQRWNKLGSTKAGKKLQAISQRAYFAAYEARGEKPPAQTAANAYFELTRQIIQGKIDANLVTETMIGDKTFAAELLDFLKSIADYLNKALAKLPKADRADIEADIAKISATMAKLEGSLTTNETAPTNESATPENAPKTTTEAAPSGGNAAQQSGKAPVATGDKNALTIVRLSDGTLAHVRVGELGGNGDTLRAFDPVTRKPIKGAAGSIARANIALTPIDNAAPLSKTSLSNSATSIDNIDSLIANGGGQVGVINNGRKVKFKQFSMTIDGDTAEVVFVEIDTSERGNGLGLAAYEALGKALAAKGIVLQSSKAQYANGRSVWKKLAQKGLATKGAQGVYFFNQQTLSESPEITQARKALADAQERVRISRDAVPGVVTVDMPAIEARDQAQQALNSLLSSNTSIPSSVDIAANEAATSPQNNKPEPTDAQKEAGNYEMGHLTLGGMDISIENPAGSVRSGKDKAESAPMTRESFFPQEENEVTPSPERMEANGTPPVQAAPAVAANQSAATTQPLEPSISVEESQGNRATRSDGARGDIVADDGNGMLTIEWDDGTNETIAESKLKSRSKSKEKKVKNKTWVERQTTTTSDTFLVYQADEHGNVRVIESFLGESDAAIDRAYKKAKSLAARAAQAANHAAWFDHIHGAQNEKRNEISGQGQAEGGTMHYVPVKITLPTGAVKTMDLEQMATSPEEAAQRVAQSPVMQAYQRRGATVEVGNTAPAAPAEATTPTTAETRTETSTQPPAPPSAAKGRNLPQAAASAAETSAETSAEYRDAQDKARKALEGLFAPARSSAKITHTFDDGYALTGAGLHEISAPVRAFHGTPHKVDKLRMSKVGTGEGAQAYGYGLYFAENVEVAKSYRNAGRSDLKGFTVTDKARELFKQHYPSGQAQFGPLHGVTVESAPTFLKGGTGLAAIVRNAMPPDLAAELQKAEPVGNLYTVELLPDADEFLDWDKPLSEQSEKVKAAISKWTEAFDSTTTAGQWYADMTDLDPERPGTQAKIFSQKLSALGIPGIKYLDAGSRGTGDGTRNFVIFDENLVRILEENGKPVDPILSPARASTNIEQLAVPENRTDAIIQTARSIIAAKIRTPEGLAAFLDDTFAGKARGYSEAIWDAIGMVDKTLRGTHDWNAIYAGIDETPEITDTVTYDTQPDIRQGDQAPINPDRGGQQGDAAQSGQPKLGEDLGAGVPDNAPPAIRGGNSNGVRKRPQRNGPATIEGDAGGRQGESITSEVGNDTVLSGPGTGLAESTHSPDRSNYFLADPESIVGGGPKARFSRNRKALEILETLQEENREPTTAELDTLAAYTGWGSFGQELFKGTYDRTFPAQGWEEESDWLKMRLGKEDWQSAQESILNAHYTDPPTVSAMWDMIRRMGFTGGRVLEPSLGIGNFFSLMPRDLMASSQLTGIELDPTTAAIARFLHPQANIKQMGYEESTTADNFYDLVVGNWPFKKGGPADRRYNQLNASLHDYFFVKAIDQVRPGGLVVGITSAGTMDKKGKAVRTYLAARGELVASFRLPTGAFGKYAATNVVTDIIILRKRETPLTDVSGETWVESVKDSQDRDFFINAYYQTQEGRSNVLGRLDFGSGSTYGRPSMIVNRLPDFEEVLPSIANRLPEGIMQPWKPQEKKITYIANTSSFRRQNAIVVQGDELYQVNGESLGLLQDIKAWRTTKDTAKRLADAKSLLNLRGLLDSLMDAYRTGGETTASRDSLKTAYEQHIREHGPLHKSKMLDLFRRAGDPTAADILNMEEMTAKGPRPRAILTQDIMRKRIPSAQGSIADAYALTRNNSLDFRVADVAQAAGVTEQQAEAFLIEQGQIFRTPQGVWEPADVYLAGNVRQKLREAKDAASQGIEGMERNIAALESIQPADTPYFEIEVQMGAAWIPLADYRDYISSLLQTDPENVELVKGSSGYNVRILPRAASSSLARSQWGTEEVHPTNMFTAAMNGTALKVYSAPDENGVKHLLTEQTEMANQKKDEIRENLAIWLWGDPIRTARLVQEYNEAMNAVVTPRRDGSHLRLEGLALTMGRGEFDFRQHQRDAVWRFLLDGKGVAAHEVGTGKTFTMAGLALEGRRLGVMRKPMILAHNANSSAIASDFTRAYPSAKILYLDDLGPQARENAMRQIKLDDWDAVVVPHSLITRFSLKRETMMKLVQKQLDQLENEFIAALDELDGVDANDISIDDDYADIAKTLRNAKGGHTAKELAKARKKIMEDIEKRAMSSSKEGAITFEDLGIDAILVDEAHIFKKIPLATRKNFKGLNKTMSGAGFQLQLMTDYLKSVNNGKGVFLFTGTPVTNTLNEVFNMMRFVMEDEFTDAQVENFDDWFNAFAQATTDIELTSGGTFEPIERVLSFINIPELARMAGRVFDVVRANDMPEFTPRASDEGLTENPVGRPRKLTIPVVAEMSQDQRDHKADLERRYREYQELDGKGKLHRKRTGGDVPAIIETDGRKSALDHRIFAPGAADHPGSKLNLMVGNIMEHYREHPQATQMVFQEIGVNDYTDRERTLRGADGTPIFDTNGNARKEKFRVRTFNLLRDMVEKLVAQGVKPEEIAIFHNMSLDPASERPDDVLRKVRRITSATPKEVLADMMNKGEIRVSFGSTQTMGTGVNAQDWLRAMHHLDAPWTPGEFEQRNGRGWRQGNRWNTVMEYRYFTESSHDGKMWQTLLNKVRFIERFIGMLQGKGAVSRVLEGEGADTSEDGSSSDFEQSFSSAAGDPRLLVRAKLEKEVAKLQRRRQVFINGLAQSRDKIRDLERWQGRDATTLPKLEQDHAAFLTSKEPFSITIQGRTFEKRDEATDAMERLPRFTTRQKIGEFGSFSIYAESTYSATRYEAVGPSGMTYTFEKPSMASLEATLGFLKRRASNIQEDVTRRDVEIKALTESLNKSWSRESELVNKEKALQQIQLEITASPTPAPSWLRHGAPVGSLVYVRNQSGELDSLDVAAHRWDANDYWILVDNGTDLIPIRYSEALTEDGSRLFQYYPYNAPGANTPSQPTVMEGEGIQSAPRLGIDDPEFAAALAEIEATLPSPAELAALHERAGIDWGASPTGDELAQLAQNRRWSSRAAYDEQREREQHDDWNEEARVIVDYNEKGAIRELASIASQGIGMTAVQTKTAQILLPRLTVRSIMNGDKQAFADAGTLTWGYDIAGTETARGLAARHQPHLSPEETHREFLAKAMFTPDRLTRERIRQAPSPDEKAERIAELEAELEQTRKDAVARERDMLSQMSAISNKMAEGKQAAMQKAKAALQSARAQAKADIAKLTDDLANVRKEKDKFQLLAEANEARLEEIRTAFADMGVTLEQVLITKEAKLAIQGTNVVKGVFAQFTERERKAVKHRLDGFSNRQIAKYTGISLSGLDAIFGKFDAALMSKFEAMAAQGITVEDFEAMDAAGNRIDIDKLIDKDGNLLAPARPTPTPEEIKTRAMAMFRAIMPSDEARKSGALKRTKGEQPGTEAPYGFDLSRPEHAAMLVRAINRLDSNGMDMVYEFWINGLLSGPSTQVANIAGNTGAALLEYGIQRPIAALVNATLFRDAAGPSLGEFQSMARYAGSAAATAFRFAKIAWQTEVTLFDSQWLNKPITVQGTSARGQIERFALPGKFGRVVRIPTRLLGMADEFAKNLVGQLEAAAQAHRIAKAEGLTGDAFDTRVDQLVRIPGSAAWIAAVEQAHKLTFTEELPDTMQKMQNVLHSKAKTPMGAVIKTLLRFIFPFVRTPYNIFKTGLRKTPLGSARMVGKGLAAWRGGRPFFDSYPKAAIATDLAEQLIGYMVTWLLIGAGEGDPDDDKKLLLITGTRSRNDNIGEDQLLRRTRGGETSILWKGKPIFNYGRYEPFATVIATIVDAGREMKRVKGGTPVATAMKSAVFDVIDQARSKTFLQGFEGLMSLMDERSGKNPVDSAIKFIAQGIVPNLIRQPLRNVDNYARDTRNAPWYYSALPFGSLAEPLYDLYGRPVQKGGSPVSRLFMAEPDKQLPIETADKAMRAFAANHPLEAKFLSNPTRAAFRYKDAFGKFKDMTPQEAALYRKTAGQRFKVESAGVLPAPLAPTPEDMTQLGNAKEKAFRDVKSEMFTGGVAPVIPPRKWPSLSEIFGQRLRQ